MTGLEHRWCAGCRAETTWKQGRTRAKCTGCGTEFPCAACKHWDCREARGEVAPDAQGVLRPAPRP